jgi:hypothetical protein
MIRPLNIRDATYIAANLRPEDDVEMRCQVREFDPVHIGTLLAQQRYAWSISHNGAPVMMVGLSPISAVGLSGWALATDKVSKVVKTATRFCRGPVVDQFTFDGFRWVEVRVHTSNHGAVRWVRGFGARPLTPLPGYGSGGEHFTLFRWG